MKQNIYDDPNFFAGYSKLKRSTDGLAGAPEWPIFRSMLPDSLAGKRVLDLGCGFGALCRYLGGEGASVIGIDLSRNMLDEAARRTSDPRVEYRLGAIEDLGFASGSFDLVVSSLALHYVERFDCICASVRDVLAPGGSFCLSVEHPMFTSRAAQAWHVDDSGKRLHWPVDDYQRQGIRHAKWIADDVVKYHRTVETYVNTLLDAGFALTRLFEPAPSAEAIAERPELTDELRRPIFLMLGAVRR